MAESQLERGFIGPPKKLIKRRYDHEKRSRSSARKRNMFSWENVDGVRIPYIFRADRKYVLVSVINEQLLARYPRWYPEEILNCPPLLSVGISVEEADMLNQMEKRIFGDIGGPFLTGDLVVELDAALSFYATLRDHYQREGGSAPTPKDGTLFMPTDPNNWPAVVQQPGTPVNVNDVSMAGGDVRPNIRAYVPGYSVGYMHVIPDGWVLVHNAVVPCIRRITGAGQSKLLPLPVVEEGIGKLTLTNGEIDSSPVECFVLSAMCRAVGHQFTFPAGLKLINLGAVLESTRDVLLHRLSDQDPFQCALDIINKRLQDAELQGFMSPTYGSKSTSADPPSVKQSEPTYKAVPPEGENTVGKDDSCLNCPTTASTNKINTSSDEGFAELCAAEVLDLSMHRSCERVDPGRDVKAAKPTVRSKDAIEGGFGCNGNTTAPELVNSANLGQVEDGELKAEQAVSKTLFDKSTENKLTGSFAAMPTPENVNQFQQPPNGMPMPTPENVNLFQQPSNVMPMTIPEKVNLFQQPPNGMPMPTPENVNLFQQPRSINERNMVTYTRSLQNVGTAAQNTATTHHNLMPVQTVDAQPTIASGSLLGCNNLTTVRKEDIQSMNPPIAIPRGKKRKTADLRVDNGKRNAKRNTSKQKNDHLLAFLSKQNGLLPVPGPVDQRCEKSSAAVPCTLYQLTLKRCRALFGERIVQDGRVQPERNLTKGHLKKWLMTRSKAQKHATKRATDVGVGKPVSRKIKRHKSVRKHSQMAESPCKSTDPDTNSQASKEGIVTSLSATDKNPGGETSSSVSSSNQRGTTGYDSSKPKRPRCIPTLCQLVDDINKPPVKHKRKCPFADAGSLPKLPFLGLNGSHMLSSMEYGTQASPSANKDVPTAQPVAKVRKIRSGSRKKKGRSFLNGEMKPTSGETPSVRLETRTAVSKWITVNGTDVERNDSGSPVNSVDHYLRNQTQSTTQTDLTNIQRDRTSYVEISGCGRAEASRIPSQYDKPHVGQMNGIQDADPVRPACGYPSSARSITSEKCDRQRNEGASDRSKGNADGNNLLATSSILAETNELLEGRVDDDREKLPTHGVSDVPSTMGPSLRPDCLTNDSDVTGNGVPVPVPQFRPDVHTLSGNKDDVVARSKATFTPLHNTATPTSHEDHTSSTAPIMFSPVGNVANPSVVGSHANCSAPTMPRPVTNVTNSSDETGHVKSWTNPILRPVTDLAQPARVADRINKPVDPLLQPVIDTARLPSVGDQTKSTVNPPSRAVNDVQRCVADNTDGIANPSVRPVIDTARPFGVADQTKNTVNSPLKPVNDMLKPSDVADNINSSVNPTPRPVIDIEKPTGVGDHINGSVNPPLRSVADIAKSPDILSHTNSSVSPPTRPVNDIPEPPQTAYHISSSVNPPLRPVSDIANASGAADHISSSANTPLRPVADTANSSSYSSHISSSINPVLRPATDITEFTGDSIHINHLPASIFMPVSHVFGSVENVRTSVNNIPSNVYGSPLPVIGPVHTGAILPSDIKTANGSIDVGLNRVSIAQQLLTNVSHTTTSSYSLSGPVSNAHSVKNSIESTPRLVSTLNSSSVIESSVVVATTKSEFTSENNGIPPAQVHYFHRMPVPVLKPVYRVALPACGAVRTASKTRHISAPISAVAVLSGNANQTGDDKGHHAETTTPVSSSTGDVETAQSSNSGANRVTDKALQASDVNGIKENSETPVRSKSFPEYVEEKLEKSQILQNMEGNPEYAIDRPGASETKDATPKQEVHSSSAPEISTLSKTSHDGRCHGVFPNGHRVLSVDAKTSDDPERIVIRISGLTNCIRVEDVDERHVDGD
ncbi:hypothetical protein LSH36_148g07013 [Paralvinella palmiformis]|uniref:Uncharacterized protein n=1 Tax=Paralvinella palmiformis TaxID=53620 RepID=A0AAD9JUK5_9ANNE|nr:hypothetical protein LSH36_148g07013 [Paralvinella palmiformis]